MLPFQLQASSVRREPAMTALKINLSVFGKHNEVLPFLWLANHLSHPQLRWMIFSNEIAFMHLFIPLKRKIPTNNIQGLYFCWTK